MTIDTDIEEEFILLHDFEHEAPCDFIDSEMCGNSAAWRLVRRCCGFVSLLCDQCKESDREWLESWHFVGVITCVECGTTLEIKSQSDAYTIIERL